MVLHKKTPLCTLGPAHQLGARAGAGVGVVRSGQIALGWPQRGWQKDSGDRWRKAQKPNGAEAVKNRTIAMGDQTNRLRCLVMVMVVRCV